MLSITVYARKNMTLLATLYPTPPYNFPLLLDVLSRFAHPTLDVVRDGAYWRAVRSGDGLALVKVTDHGTTDAPALDVHLVAQTGAVDAQTALADVQHILYTDAGRADFLEMARVDERLWRLVAPLVGLPEWRTINLFEALMQTIIEQQIAWTTAQRAQRWLVEWAGACIAHDGAAYYTFPTPARLAAASVDDLTPLNITFKRMALMIDLARQIAGDALNLQDLADAAPDDAYRQLLSIKGIGHWTAAVTLERAFGHKNWIAYNDVVLQSATNRYFYGGIGRIPPGQVTDTFAPYGAYAGLAAHYTLIRWVIDQYPVKS